MSNYTKATNFAVKDALSSGDPSKLVKGTEIDTEFNAIASAITSKADSNSPTLTGTPVAPTAAVGTNSTQIATTAFVHAERTSTATLTNKTLTSPTINGGSISSPTITSPTINSSTINSPTISGGSISGITDLAIADGGTGASTAANARTNLGLGSLATQNSNSVSITGGNITGLTSLSSYGAGGSSTNAALGSAALDSNTSGVNNTGIGKDSLTRNTTGFYNTAVGSESLSFVSSGLSNTAIGYQAALSCTTGNTNVAVGAAALRSNTTANYNVAVGGSALYSNTTATANTAVGWSAGSNITTGYNNTCIGANAQPSGSTGYDEIVIGGGNSGIGARYVSLGTTSGRIYNAYTVNATWTQTSDERLKKNIKDDSLGLSFINRLRPVTYQWKPSNEIDPSLPYYQETNDRDIETVMHGLVAQEVKAALDAEGVNTFAGWDMTNDTIQAISREMFITPLINAIKELSDKCDALQAEVDALKGS